MARRKLAYDGQPIKRLQLILPLDSIRRLNVEAARRDIDMSEVVFKLAQQLPAVEVLDDKHSSQLEPVGARSGAKR